MFNFCSLFQGLQFGHNTSLYESGNKDEVIGDYRSLANKTREKGIVSESAYYGFKKKIGVDISKLDDVQPDGDF